MACHSGLRSGLIASSAHARRGLGGGRSLVLALLAAAAPACVAGPGAPETESAAATASALDTSRDVAEYDFAAGDFDHDGKADLSVKLDGAFKIDFAANGFGSWDRTIAGYGDLSGRSVPADYDGDGSADLAVKTTDGKWRIDYAANGFGAWDVNLSAYGGIDAIPVPADYDGDGKTDLAVKTEGGTWLIDYAAGGFGGWNDTFPGYGSNWYYPVPADFDGDGKTDLSTKDGNGNWYIDFANDGFGKWNKILPGYGGTWFAPAPADYDGDRKADISTKDGNGNWRIDFAANGFGVWDATYSGYGPSTVALPADYDGDHKADLGAKEECGPWFIDESHNGFVGWNAIARSAAADNLEKTVTTGSALVSALRAGFPGTIRIPANADIDLTGQRDVPIRSCTRLVGTRDKLDPGALLHVDTDGTAGQIFQVTGHDIRIEGLRFRGPEAGRRDIGLPYVAALEVSIDPRNGDGRKIRIENNEMFDWLGAAVGVSGKVFSNDPTAVPADVRVLPTEADQVLVTRNFIHHNARDGAGYGVVVASGAYAAIKGNVFNFNRHAIAGNGSPYTGYIAQYNYVLEGGYSVDSTFDYWNQHFDMHGVGDGGYGGIAGEVMDIGYNTFRGAQSYGLFGVKTRPAFMLRGRAMVRADFHDNVAVHDNLDDAVSLKMSKNDTGYGEDQAAHNFFASGNAFDTDASLNVAAGDFDADGHDDVFLGTGAGWYYSSAGTSEWRWINAASQHASELRFGQFDDDPATDVFAVMDGSWYFSSGGKSAWKLLRSGVDVALDDLLFGDFDGNGSTDVLYADGTKWFLSAGARGLFTEFATSSYRARDLRVGDFNGDRRDDIFSTANGDWSWRTGPGTTAWQKLNDNLGDSSIGQLRLADFNGDGRTDVARSFGGTWRISASGTGAWQTIRTPGAQSEYGDLAGTLIGDFINGDGRADVLRWNLVPLLVGGSTTPTYRTGNRFVAWSGASSGGFAEYSRYDMR